MAIHDVSIKRALPSQQDLKDRPEHCSVDAQALAAIGCALGEQVRIVRSGADYGLYTVSEVRQETPRDDIVRMGLDGRRRLDMDEEFEAVLDSQVVHPTLSEEDAEAGSEFIERLDDDGTQSALIAIAPHGGDIERCTDEQAERVAERLAAQHVSSWRCKGWKRGGGAFARWHITAGDINPAGFPRLGSVFSRRFAHAVAFHGLGEDEILIGGAASLSLKQEIRAEIEGATNGSGIKVRIAAGGGSDGDDPRNIVNRLTAGGANGIQIEQSLEARSRYGMAIADAVARVYARKL